MKFIYTLFLLVSAGITASGQQPVAAPAPSTSATTAETVQPASKIVEPMAVCDLTQEHSPFINGLKLRMPEPEAALKLGGPFEQDPTDQRRKRIEIALDKNPIFEGDKIVSGRLTAADGKVTSFRLTYARPWTTAKEFVNSFAPKLGLVRIAFRLDDEKREAKINCKDFTVELRAAGPGSELLVTGAGAAKTQ